jgi:hypothetical protein
MYIDIFSDARLIHNMIDIRTTLHITYIYREKKRTELQTIQTNIHKKKNYNNNNAIENY